VAEHPTHHAHARLDYDVVVAGLGGMGSSAAAQCAARGARVLGVEQFARGHGLGASSGKSRVIRRAYFENAAYVPLLDRAYELWRDLEARTGTKILHADGLLTAGYRGSPIVAGAEEAVGVHGVDAQTWSAVEIRRNYPALLVDDDSYGVFEPEGGFVVPEAAISGYTSLAERWGAELRFETAMTGWRSEGEAVRIELSDGTDVLASKLILTLGPWFAELLGSCGVPLRIQRNVAAWFRPREPLGPGRLPTFLIHRRDLPAPFYGFPDVGDGVKAAFHGHGATTDPQSLDRGIDVASDIEPIAAAFEAWAPGAAHEFLEAKACMYALTPDEHFVIGAHPRNDGVVILGGFSGHGFKFASVVGEIAAELALERRTRHRIGFLALQRFY
jgi:sarcosine oxidase